MRRVLFAWADWSLFPAAFTDGLEAVFYQSEAEVAAVQSQLAAQDPPAWEAAEAEALQKKARSCGLFLSRYGERATARDLREMQLRLEAVEAFRRRKRPVAVLPEEETRPPEAEQQQQLGRAEAEDVDGEPLEAAEAEEMDLDGEPLAEDLDGEPIDGPFPSGGEAEDIDGLPLDEDDDIDGEPL